MSLREKVKEMNKEDACDYLIDIITKYQISNRPNQKKKSERFLEIINTNSSSSKITINPISGRVTLKISNESLDGVKKEITKLAEIVMSFDNFPSFTHRGEIKFDEYNNEYYVVMRCSNRMFGGIKFEVSVNEL